MPDKPDNFTCFLRLGELSTSSVNAICDFDLGYFIVTDECGDRVVLGGSDGVYDGTPGPALDCLNSEARDRELRYNGKARLYEPGGRPAFRPPDGLTADCTDFATANRLNKIIDTVLGSNPKRSKLFCGAVEEAPCFTLADGDGRYLRLINLGSWLSNNIQWRTKDGIGHASINLNLPRLPALLAEHRPDTDPYFWGRVRCMIVEEMDKTGRFVSDSGCAD